jgi:hypothetical protein
MYRRAHKKVFLAAVAGNNFEQGNSHTLVCIAFHKNVFECRMRCTDEFWCGIGVAVQRNLSGIRAAAFLLMEAACADAD